MINRRRGGTNSGNRGAGGGWRGALRRFQVSNTSRTTTTPHGVLGPSRTTTAFIHRKNFRLLVLFLGSLVAAYLLFDRSQSQEYLSTMDDVSSLLFGIQSTTSKYSPLSKNLEAIPRFHANSVPARAGSEEAVLLEGWKSPKGDWSRVSLMQKVGHFPQYLKDATVQPLRNIKQEPCVVSGELIANLLASDVQASDNLLFFTNNQENEPFMRLLREVSHPVPPALRHINGFEVFSAMRKHQSHSFHKHGESWLGQVEGRRQWWFLPPTSPKPPRVNACNYLTGEASVPKGATTIMQYPGEIIWFPKDWYHATCALDDWTVGIGAQQGPTIRQNFPKLDDSKSSQAVTNHKELEHRLQECLRLDASVAKKLVDASTSRQPQAASTAKASGSAANLKQGDENWKWFDGDLNAYYNSLEKDHNRDPSKPADYAVHRWLGPSKSTEEHYQLLDGVATNYLLPTWKTTQKHRQQPLQVLDGGCGLGSALMWLEGKHPDWNFTGYTVSEEQFRFIEDKLPDHKFQVNLQSYNDLKADVLYDYIYSIEALIHSPDVSETIEIWAQHLAPGGIMAIIDDFVAEDVDPKNTVGMEDFAKSWLANSLFSTTDLSNLGARHGLQVIENLDMTAKYKIVERNYRNKIPDIRPFGGRTHQGWMGSKWRQRLTVEGKLTYNMLVLQKPLESRNLESTNQGLKNSFEWRHNSSSCTAIPTKSTPMEENAEFTAITPQLMSGKGKNGGNKMACISGWYCCNKGTEWWDRLDRERTDNTDFLKLDRNLFGHYIDAFAKHLNEHYNRYPRSTSSNAQLRFLDIGGTGSTASGMTQVTSKFQHFAGPTEYWKLDSDSGAQNLERTLYCDIDNCPQAETCGFDVTFSHTVLEHSRRPWLAFDTIARITKQGGLTMHLVPFSYQYHATPDDNYRFSHKALVSLLEDRGFEVLEVGYDICSKPDHMLRRVDEHYDVIWLSYVIGKKL